MQFGGYQVSRKAYGTAMVVGAAILGGYILINAHSREVGSAPYRAAMDFLKHDQCVANHLGSVHSVSLPLFGTDHVRETDALFNVIVTGSRHKANATVQLYPTGDRWQVASLRLTISAKNGEIVCK